MNINEKHWANKSQAGADYRARPYMSRPGRVCQLGQWGGQNDLKFNQLARIATNPLWRQKQILQRQAAATLTSLANLIRSMTMRDIFTLQNRNMRVVVLRSCVGLSHRPPDVYTEYRVTRIGQAVSNGASIVHQSCRELRSGCRSAQSRPVIDLTATPGFRARCETINSTINATINAKIKQCEDQADQF